MPEVASRLLAVVSVGSHRVAGLWHELAGAVQQTANARSRFRLVSDVVLFRVLRLWPSLGDNAPEREIQLRGARLTYRLNRGDIQGIREVWTDGVYRMPPPHAFRVVVDLGTNVALTSVWLQRQYGAELVIGVEPDQANVKLARRNFEANDVHGSVVHAAVGPSDGEARFAPAKGASNLGHVATDGETVRQISMNTVLGEIPSDQRIDLLKIDIEGGEQDLLLADDVFWLDRVDAIIAEFHPDRVDIATLVDTLERRGFTYYPAGTLWKGSMDIFRKPNIR
ncbi:MAG: FkbM family methyltransferase [Solirubrobacteraceae bacterium]